MDYCALNGIMEPETQLSQYHKPQQYMNKQRKHICAHVQLRVGFPGDSDGKESTCNAGDLSSVSRKIPQRRE